MNTSEKNYKKHYDEIKQEINMEGGFQKVTEVRILDRMLQNSLITEDFHKKKLKTCITQDKYEERNEMLYSLLISASALSFMLLVFVPDDEKFTRVLFSIYIFVVYVIAYLYYN